MVVARSDVSRFLAVGHVLCSYRSPELDVGGGIYEPLYNHQGGPPAQAPANYGSTGGGYSA